jgi:hypothetical protein
MPERRGGQDVTLPRPLDPQCLEQALAHEAQDDAEDPDGHEDLDQREAL